MVLNKEQFLGMVKEFLVELLNGQAQLGTAGLCYYLKNRFIDNAGPGSNNTDYDRCYFLGSRAYEDLYENLYDSSDEYEGFEKGVLTESRKKLAEKIIEAIDADRIEIDNRNGYDYYKIIP